MHLSGSATAPLRVLKPKLASTSKHKGSSHQRDRSLAEDSKLYQSIEAEKNINTSANYHGLYQSLEADKVGKAKKDPGVSTTSEQFESIEPSRVYKRDQVAVDFDKSKRSSPLRQSSKSRSPSIATKYSRKGERESDALKRMNKAAGKIQSFVKRQQTRR